MKKIKRRHIVVLLILTFVISIAFIFFAYKKAVKKPFVTNEKTVKVVVNEGENLTDVLDDLHNKGEIQNLLYIKAYLKIKNINYEVKQGTYNVLKETSLDNLIKVLKSGGDFGENEIKFTVPEGYNVNEIANLLEKAGLCSKEEFILAIKNYKLPKYIVNDDKKRYNLEGYLFPDTYIVNKNATPNEVISIMLKRFNETLNEAKKKTNVSLADGDIEKTIIIASMIEKEARVSKDRELISSVINNRISKKMPLQIDATVLYALGEHKEKLYYKDLEIDSPYNTYKVSGMPIGAICNPGIESIEAALSYGKTNYIYYILQKDDSHYFTNNYEDFLKKKKDLGY